jgi:hypothetical protein
MNTSLSTTILLLVAVCAIMGPAADASADATVYVVHGIPDVAVDVAVDSQCVLEGFALGDQAGPLSLSAGAHQITISLADMMDPCGGTVVLDATVPFASGENVTLVAYLDEMCNPTAGKFPNDFSRTDPGKARLILHHTACAPEADIAVDRDIDAPFVPDATNFENGDQIVEQMRPGEWYVWLAETGSTVPALGPVLVRLKPFMTYRAFAVGSIALGNATVLLFETRSK